VGHFAASKLIVLLRVRIKDILGGLANMEVLQPRGKPAGFSKLNSTVLSHLPSILFGVKVVFNIFLPLNSKEKK